MLIEKVSTRPLIYGMILIFISVLSMLISLNYVNEILAVFTGSIGGFEIGRYIEKESRN